MSKKPSAAKFREALQKTGGNLSEVARIFGVVRSQITVWKNSDPEFANAIIDERGALLDKCLVSSRVLALGIPKYENEYDADGNILVDANGNPRKRVVGWIERPDSNMLRYLMGTLGRYEGFDENMTVSLNPSGSKGVDVEKWLEKETEDNTEETEEEEE